jgi:Flp pilus assembly pilin Flp
MLADESGATLVEYTLILTFIAVVSILAVKLLGQSTSSLLSSAAGSI